MRVRVRVRFVLNVKHADRGAGGVIFFFIGAGVGAAVV